MQPAKIVGNPFKQDETFHAVMGYLQGTEKLIEPLYQLEKAGKLTVENEKSSEGRFPRRATRARRPDAGRLVVLRVATSHRRQVPRPATPGTRERAEVNAICCPRLPPIEPA